jgi:hypothetical protein
MVRLLAFLTLFALSACEQQSPYASYPQYPNGPYQQNSYPYQYQENSSGWQRNRSANSSSYGGGPQQQSPGNASSQPQRWVYPDGSVRYGTYDPNTGMMK